MHHNYKILKQNVNKMYRKKSIYLNDQCFFFDIMKQTCIFYGRCVLLTMLNIVNIDKGGTERIHGTGDREHGREGSGWVVGVVWQSSVYGVGVCVMQVVNCASNHVPSTCKNLKSHVRHQCSYLTNVILCNIKKKRKRKSSSQLSS